MDLVYKWVERYELKPTPQTKSNAKKKMSPTQWYKFLELINQTQN